MPSNVRGDCRKSATHEVIGMKHYCIYEYTAYREPLNRKET